MNVQVPPSGREAVAESGRRRGSVDSAGQVRPGPGGGVERVEVAQYVSAKTSVNVKLGPCGREAVRAPRRRSCSLGSV